LYCFAVNLSRHIKREVLSEFFDFAEDLTNKKYFDVTFTLSVFTATTSGRADYRRRSAVFKLVVSPKKLLSDRTKKRKRAKNNKRELLDCSRPQLSSIFSLDQQGYRPFAVKLLGKLQPVFVTVQTAVFRFDELTRLLHCPVNSTVST
jgi:hypothetical protein